MDTTAGRTRSTVSAMFGGWNDRVGAEVARAVGESVAGTGWVDVSVAGAAEAGISGLSVAVGIAVVPPHPTISTAEKSAVMSVLPNRLDDKTLFGGRVTVKG